jgi:YVTN family beta-propeller protein
MDMERTVLSIKRIKLSSWIAAFLTLVAILPMLLGARNSWAGSTRFISTDAVHRKLASSVIAITNDGSLLVTVNPDSNSISLINTIHPSLIAEISVGDNPSSVEISLDGTKAFVANQGSDTLSVVDLVAKTVIDEIPLGDRPVGVLLSPDGNTLAISEFGMDQVRLLDPINFSTQAVIPVADRPFGLSFTPNGRYLLLSHLLSGEVTILIIRPYQYFFPLVLSSDSNQVPVDPSTLFAQNMDSGSTRTTITTWPNIAPSPSVIVNADGKRAYLPQTMANGLGLNTTFDTSVFPKISVLNLETWAHQTSEHISLPEIDRPVGLPWDAALNLDESELWVVNAASNNLSVIDISDPDHPGRLANIPVGDNPRGITFSPEGDLAYVNNTLSGTVSQIDTDTYRVTHLINTTKIPLPPVLLNGKRLFFSSARPDLAQAAWISCNNCHIEGEHDGRTWLLQFLGEVPPGEQAVIRRNTTSLLGMIETYPLRWSAEWDESADSEFSIRFEQFGTGLITGEMHPTLGDPNQGRSYDLDCLAAYIDSLKVPTHVHSLSEAEKRGKEIFESPETQCASCHPSPLYTDLQSHDVGTANGEGEWFGPMIDTPTLRFLYDSAPYLHDGSAETLRDVLTQANPNDQHGVTSVLMLQEIDDLIAFLLILPYEE